MIYIYIFRKSRVLVSIHLVVTIGVSIPVVLNQSEEVKLIYCMTTIVL